MRECMRNFRKSTNANSTISAAHWRKTKLKLFGHILRSSPAGPLNQVLFASDNLHPRTVLKRRVGRLTADWFIETYAYAYKVMHGQRAVFDIENLNHLQTVKHQAIQRLSPF